MTEVKIKLNEASQFYSVNSDKYSKSCCFCHFVGAHDKRGYCFCYGVKLYAVASGTSNAQLSNQELGLSYRIKKVTDHLSIILTRLLPLSIGN